MSYIPWGHKESDTTERLNNKNDSRALGKTVAGEDFWDAFCKVFGLVL